MKKIIIGFLMCGIVCMVINAQTLPSQFKVYCPEYIVEMKGNPKGMYSMQEWQDWAITRIQNNDFGKNTKSVWVVYSDRENNTTYTSASSSSGQHSKLGFIEKLFVADISNGYALVFTDDYSNVYPTINPTARCRGWISINNLLLWETCPKNQSQIFQKGLIVHDPTKQKSAIEKNPPYLLEPRQTASKNSNQRAKDLDILFVMKTAEVDNTLYYLLSKEMNCKGRERAVYGWLPEDYITRWDQRLVFEPTFATSAVRDYHSKQIKPSIYFEESQALLLYSNGESKNPFWEYGDFSAKRMDAYTMRNPIISETSPGVYRVAAISSLGMSSKTIADNTKQIEALKEAQNNINVIFVIDATSSMKKYYTPVADALTDIMRRDFSQNIKVGAVLYKDYKDPDKISYKPVTTDINEIVGFITSSQSSIGSIDADDYEALFLGLETGLDLNKMRYKSSHSNFMILIGDAGNHRTDPQGRKWQDNVASLAGKMSVNNINFLAYQVNNAGAAAYDDFAMQIGKLQSELADKIKLKMKSMIEGSDNLEFKLKSNRFYSLARKSSSVELPVYDSYKYASSGQSETTNGMQNIITQNISDFQEFISNKLELLEANDLGVSSDGNLKEQRLREIFSLADWDEKRINDYIDYLKKGGTAKFLGFAPEKTTSSIYKLFEYVLFFSQDELTDLIQELDKINKPNVISSKKAYQDAVISMGQAMLGQFNETDIRNMDMDQLLGQIYGVPIRIQSCGIKIDKILSMDQSILDEYIKQFKDKLQGLKNINENSYNGRFKSNGITYYWIPFSEMPGFCEGK